MLGLPTFFLHIYIYKQKYIYLCVWCFLNCFFLTSKGSKVIKAHMLYSWRWSVQLTLSHFEKTVSQRSWTWHLAWELLPINSATRKFTREEPPSGWLTLRMPEPTVDPTNYWNQSRPMILRQNIPEFYQVRFAMDPTLSKYFLRWILLCPTLVCDGTYPNPFQSASGETDWKPRTCLKQFGGFCAICLKWM